jgi:hypothetical protein
VTLPAPLLDPDALLDPLALLDPDPPLDPKPLPFGLVGTLQNVAVISSSQIMPLLGVSELSNFFMCGLVPSVVPITDQVMRRRRPFD